MTEEQQHISDGWRIWLAERIVLIQGSLGSLQAQTSGITHRMDRLEDRMARNGNGHKRHWLTYLKHIPWQFLILLALTALVITGHITLADVKALIIKKLQEF
jgi:hypothetical protein